jgi:hypothetical protein
VVCCVLLYGYILSYRRLNFNTQNVYFSTLILHFSTLFIFALATHFWHMASIIRYNYIDKTYRYFYIDTGVRFWEIDNFVLIEIPGPGNKKLRNRKLVETHYTYSTSLYLPS